MAVYAGVDLGATNIRAIVATADRTELGRDTRPTPAATNGRDVTEAVLDALRAACRAADVEPHRIQAVGVGSIGPLDLARGAVVEPANLPDAIDEIALEEPLSSFIGGGPVTIHNDTVAGVIAERTYSTLNPDDMVYLTMSSGIGAGVCVDGQILRGWDGNAGEVGHLTIDGDGAMTCGCGAPGHWEAYCSGENIPRYARYLHAEGACETGLDLESLTAATIFESADDELASRVIDRVAHWNTLGFANIVNAYAPLVISVGGAVALNNSERILEPVRDRVAEYTVANVPEIKTTDLGADVVLNGALASVTPE